MPQEFHVLRCYSCETFQVHIVKKSNKWSCKMCGEKQSLKKVYAKGAAKDCRTHVQSLNEKRILSDLNQSIDNQLNINYNYEQDTAVLNSTSHEVEPNQSKWKEYETEKEENQLSELECENSEYTFERPSKRKKISHSTTKKIQKTECHDNEDKIASMGYLEEIKTCPNERQDEEICRAESKWNSFVIESQDEEDSNGFVNTQSCTSSNIFSSTDITSLDDILDI